MPRANQFREPFTAEIEFMQDQHVRDAIARGAGTVSALVEQLESYWIIDAAAVVAVIARLAQRGEIAEATFTRWRVVHAMPHMPEAKR